MTTESTEPTEDKIKPLNETASIPSSGDSSTGKVRQHKYLAFECSPGPIPRTKTGPKGRTKKTPKESKQEALAKDFALVLANYYAGKDLSRNQWRKIPHQVCEWYKMKNEKGSVVEGSRMTSKPFHLKTIDAQLFERRSFLSSEFDLPVPFCDWLDGSINMAPWFHAPSTDPRAKIALTFVGGTPFGPRFPIKPALDREGIIMSSFQTSLINRIAVLRSRLVENSNVSDQADWFEDLRSLITTAISLLDTTLHQIYFKAEFAPLPSWTFDRARLGERHGRKLVDKLRWVQAITGRLLHLQGVENSLEGMRRVRNHLQHLDPPMFCFTMEDACRWINQSVDLAEINWRIRDCLNVLPCKPLLELLLSPRVVFVPEDPNKRRVQQPRHIGYGSTSAERLEGTLPAHQFQDEAVFINNLPQEPVFTSRTDVPAHSKPGGK